jgi:hypothetical protein
MCYTFEYMNTNTTFKNSFSIEESLQYGWNAFKSNWQFFAKMALIIFLITIGLELIFWGIETYWQSFWSTHIDTDPDGFETLIRDPRSATEATLSYVYNVIINLIGTFVSFWLTFNSAKMYFNFMDKKTLEISQLWAKPNTQFYNYLGGMIAVGCVLLLGFIFFIIPGIYLALRFSSVQYLIIDKNLSIGGAFKNSSILTQGVKWNILGYWIICMFIAIGAVIAGIICLVLGIIPAMIATTTVFSISSAYIYRIMLKNAQDAGAINIA